MRRHRPRPLAPSMQLERGDAPEPQGRRLDPVDRALRKLRRMLGEIRVDDGEEIGPQRRRPPRRKRGRTLI